MTASERIAVFGCKSTTQFLIESLEQAGVRVSQLITISPAMGEKHEVADYSDLADWAKVRGIAVYVAKTYSLKNEQDLATIAAMNLDLAFVIGWQRLIPEGVLRSLRVGAFGMHGSSMNLPLGRGRSPMNWSILEGRKVFYTNLFQYDPGVDSGDVVDTFKFQILDTDTGETMHYKNLLAMKYLIERNLKSLLSGHYSLSGQRTDLEPTYYPKRSPSDGAIDWRLDVFQLERFIRAVTRPFAGVFTFIGTERITIWSATVFDHEEYGYGNLKEGQIAAVFPSGKFLVKAFGGLLLVQEYEGATPAIGTLMHAGGATIKVFPRNSQGYFDVEE